MFDSVSVITVRPPEIHALILELWIVGRSEGNLTLLVWLQTNFLLKLDLADITSQFHGLSHGICILQEDRWGH